MRLLILFCTIVIFSDCNPGGDKNSQSVDNALINTWQVDSFFYPKDVDPNSLEDAALNAIQNSTYTFLNDSILVTRLEADGETYADTSRYKKQGNKLYVFVDGAQTDTVNILLLNKSKLNIELGATNDKILLEMIPVADSTRRK